MIAARQHRAVGPHEVGQAQEIAERCIRLGAEILQHRGELRQHEQNKEQHHADRGHQHEGGILHRIRELAAHLFGARALCTEHFQHLVERAGDFADLDQRDVHRREQVGMRSERFSKALAGKKRGAQFADHRTQPPDIGVGRQKLKRVVEPRAGLQQQGEVARENGDFRRGRLVEQAEAAPARDAALLLDGLDRQQAQIFDTCGHLSQRRCRYGAVNDLAVLGERAVAEIGHGSPANVWW